MGAGDSDEAAMLGVGIVDDGGCDRRGFGVVDHTQIDHRQTPTIDLCMAGVVVGGPDSVPWNSRNSFLPGDSRNHSGGI